MQIAYYNGNIYTGEQILYDKAILAREGFIEAIVSQSEIPSDYKKVDARGKNIAADSLNKTEGYFYHQSEQNRQTDSTSIKKNINN